MKDVVILIRQDDGNEIAASTAEIEEDVLRLKMGLKVKEEERE